MAEAYEEIEKIINSAYNDSKGITKKFNKNILVAYLLEL